MNTKLVAAVAGVLLLAGCVNPQKVGMGLSDKYRGMHVDDFVTINGPPVGSHKMESGDTLYRFVGGQGSVPYIIPGSYSATTYSTGYGTSTTSGTSYGGGIYTEELSCALKVYTDPEGHIYAVGVEQDTGGAWKVSRCEEAF